MSAKRKLRRRQETRPMRFKTREAMAAWLAENGVGKAWHQVILHDDACTPSICVCQPEFLLEPLTTDNWISGAQAEQKWRKEGTS